MAASPHVRQVMNALQALRDSLEEERSAARGREARLVRKLQVLAGGVRELEDTLQAMSADAANRGKKSARQIGELKSRLAKTNLPPPEHESRSGHGTSLTQTVTQDQYSDNYIIAAGRSRTHSTRADNSNIQPTSTAWSRALNDLPTRSGQDNNIIILFA